MKKIFDMTKEDFAAVPYLDTWNNWDELVKDNPSGRLEFSSVVIIPAMRDGEIVIHDSEWACMDFVLVKDSVPIGKIGGCSDVLHIDGIGGIGDDRGNPMFYHMVPTKGWSIDCLPKTGYLNLWTHRVLYLRDKFVGSSAEIYSSTEMRKHSEKKDGESE